MGVISNFLKIFLSLGLLDVVRAETYSVKIGTERYVNVVSKNFLSFTIDPKYLFSTGGKYGGEQTICMAASLAPAYLRIAGPSTSHMDFHNSTITINNTSEADSDEDPRRSILDNFLRRNRKRQAKNEESFEEAHRKDKDLDEKSRKFLGNLLGRISNKKSGATDIDKLLNAEENEQKTTVRTRGLQVTSDMWKRFAKWAKATGFEMVFALNNDEKSTSGVWDPNMALDILSVAEKEDVGDIYWQLGYECANQSIDDYLNDLETLRVIVETFPQGREKIWRVAGSDVAGCLREDSKSDFKDYVALSLDIADALVLNGNSSSYELDRLSSTERSKLLRLIHASGAPLWVTRRQQVLSALPRAAAWMGSLGHSARRGAHAHFTDLTEDDLYRPSLSFYMALLFKNLVGERVLDVDIESAHTILFAHCTSLRHNPVPGAVTLYGVNMDDEPARLSIKLNKREEGGDILQFILSEDEDGNIIVNGREMTQEGDIRPVVKRVRPYKTLFLNLPAESIGFWVIANTKIEACQYIDENDEENVVEAESIEIKSNSKGKNERKKRSIGNEDSKEMNIVENHKLDEFDVVKTGNKALDQRISNLNKYLREIHNILGKMRANKVKRQAFDENQTTKKLRRQLLQIRRDFRKIDGDTKPLLGFIGNLLQFARNGTVPNERLRNQLMLHRNRIAKLPGIKEIQNKEKNNIKRLEKYEIRRKNSRARRSIINDKNDFIRDDNEESIKDNVDDDTSNSKFNDVLKTSAKENEIDVDDKENKKIWRILHNIQEQLNTISEGKSLKNESLDEPVKKSNESEKLIVETEVTDNSATIHFEEKPPTGWVKNTFENIFSTLNDLNDNLNRFWEALSIFN